MYFFFFRSGCFDFTRVSNLSFPLSAETFWEFNRCNCSRFNWNAPFRCRPFNFNNTSFFNNFNQSNNIFF
ncbi:MAG: hypothetical protein ACI4L6_01970 [Candidatus Onthoplasma sp.]